MGVFRESPDKVIHRRELFCTPPRRDEGVPASIAVKRSAALPADLALLALSVFAGAPGHPSTNWADQEYVTGNALIRKRDPGAVREMFRTSSVQVGNWAPATILTYSLDYAVW
jgi:hypothetical protein